jgi:hypothetical protein
VLLSNYLPYILGGIGLVVITGAVVYFWQSGRGVRPQGRLRHPAQAQSEAKTEVYCHQCGTRAHVADRFCRICGTRLRARV